MNQPLDDNFTQHPRLKNFLKAMQRCRGFGLYFMRCNTPSLRTELVASLKVALDKPIVELEISVENDIYIDAQIALLMENQPENAVVFIYGLEVLAHIKKRYLMNELNWRRGHYGRIEYPIVFWLPEFLLTDIFEYAPDFADWYSGIYEFSLVTPEKNTLALQAWDSVNENFVEQLSLEEKQRWIVNLKNLLAELEGNNSKSRRDLLNRLGQLYDSLGDYDKAMECYQQNLILCRELKDKENEAATLNNISQIYKVRGEYDTALGYLQSSLKICQEISSKSGEGAALNNISQIYDTKGDYDAALSYLQDSLKIHENIGDKLGIGTTLNNISQIYDAKGDYDTALSYLQESLKIHEEIGNKSGTSITLNNLSLAYNAKGDYDSSLGYLQDSLKISQEIGDTAGICVTQYNIGLNCLARGDNETAYQYWRQAYQIANKIGLAQVLTALENLAKQLGGKDLSFWETPDS
ncbi:MAG: tetratricopeptide repeat protein [Methyloprofundus sp.]|nr:tetratricopeptide repeat protein [Methyloprofundus sp.]